MTKTSRLASVLSKTALAMAVVLACVLACCWAPRAYAADDGDLTAGSVMLGSQDSKMEFYDQQYWENSKETPSIWVYNMPDNAEVTSVTSSNTKAIKINLHGDDKSNIHSYYVTIGKVGKSEVTVKFKVDKKSYTLSATYTVLKHPKAFKKITFNNESLQVPTAKNPVDRDTVYGFTGTKGKINLELADGWQLDSINVGTQTPNSPTSDYKSIQAKAGKTFSIPKGKIAFISISIHDGDNTCLNYNIDVYRTKPLELIPFHLFAGYNRNAGFESFGPNVTSEATITKVSSSNTKVMKVKKASGESVYEQVTLMPAKAGKAKVAVTYKFNGKTYTTSATYKVEKNFPVKSIKLNGKKLNLKQSTSSDFFMNYTKPKFSAVVTANTGWKIESIRYYNTKTYDPKKVKNGAKLDSPKGANSYLTIVLKNKSTKQIFPYTLCLSRT